MSVAEHIVETKTSNFDSALFEDRYRTVLISKLKEKYAELPRKTAEEGCRHHAIRGERHQLNGCIKEGLGGRTSGSSGVGYEVCGGP